MTTKQYTITEKLVFSSAIVAIAFVGYSFLGLNKTKLSLTKNEAYQINYEMAKLPTTEGSYSLEDREIERNYKALQRAKAQVAVATAQKKAVADKAKAAADKAKTEAAKVAAQKAQPALKAAQAKPVQSNKSAVMDNKANTDKASDSTLQNQAGSYTNTTAPADEATVQEPTKKTYEQWKNEVFAAQNKEAILKLASAYKKGEISAEDFQKLVKEMLVSKDDKMVGLGLYALRITPSYASYVQLVKIQGSVNSSYAAYVQESLNSYNQGSGLNVLKQALVSTDKAVIMKTLEVIKVGLNSIQNGTAAALVDPRYQRDYTTFSLSNYNSFLPLLQNIVSQSADQDLIVLANQNIDMIDPQYVAAN